MPYLHNFVPLRWDIRWDKNSHMNTKIIHRTQVSFPPNRDHVIVWELPGSRHDVILYKT